VHGMAKQPKIKAKQPDAMPAKPLPAPSDAETNAIADSLRRVRGRRTRVSVDVKMTDGGRVCKIGPKHSNQNGWGARLTDAFGTRSQDFANAELNRVLNALAPREGAWNEAINAALATIDGARPKDEIEAMLVGQMTVTHSLAMELIGRAKRADLIPQMESAGNLAVKLLRTYTAQAEALAKLRRGGEQTVRVEHVHVYPGGKAVVGNVTTGPATGGGGESENGGQPFAPGVARAFAFAPGVPLWSADPRREAVPVAGGEGKEPMPDARRSGG
jgi:hypothetical protein